MLNCLDLSINWVILYLVAPTAHRNVWIFKYDVVQEKNNNCSNSRFIDDWIDGRRGSRILEKRSYKRFVVYGRTGIDDLWWYMPVGCVTQRSNHIDYQLDYVKKKKKTTKINE